MGSVSPVAIAILIVSVVGFVGAFLAYFGDKRKYAGHEDYLKDADILKKKLHGELFRDGEDLVISGNLNRLPTVIRFSYTESTPGMNIRMAAPASFGMSIVPRGERSTEGRVLVRTSDEMFDARFVTRSDDPAQAKMFFGSRGVMKETQKLCCSSKSFVTFSHGAIEVSELAVPKPYTAQHILFHLESISRLSTQLERLPGADLIAIKPFRRERHLVLRLAILAGVVAALLGIASANKGLKEVPLSELASGDSIPVGIMPVDASHITGLSHWRVATESDFEPDAAAWLRNFGKKPSGRIDADFTDEHTKEIKVHDAAYLLVNDRGDRRIIMLANGADRYDVRLPFVGLLTKIPKSALARIEWIGRPPETPDGDAMMIVRKPQDRASGLVMYLSQGRLVTGVPADYQSVQIVE